MATTLRRDRNRWGIVSRCLIWLFLVIIIMTACGGIMPSPVARPTQSPKESKLAGLVTPNVLTVGSYVHYFPQEYIDPVTHQVTGFDIDLIRAIARQLGLKTTIISTDFQTLEPNLLANKYDVVISAVSIMPQIDRRVRFIPYFVGGESLLVRKGDSQYVNDLSDLCGQTVVVKSGTIEQNELQDTQAFCQGKSRTSIRLLVVSDYQDGLQLLLQRKAVAMYQDSPLTDYFYKHYPDRYQIGSVLMGTNIEGIMIRGNDSMALNAIRRAFVVLRANGSYHKMIEQWGLVDGELDQG